MCDFSCDCIYLQILVYDDILKTEEDQKEVLFCVQIDLWDNLKICNLKVRLYIIIIYEEILIKIWQDQKVFFN